MSVVFPVFVLAKDSREIVRYDSVAQMQYAMERIDVENEEYEAWDAHSRPLKLKVEEPLWLQVEQGEERPDEAGLRSHVVYFSKLQGVALDLNDETQTTLAIYEKIMAKKTQRRQKFMGLAQMNTGFSPWSLGSRKQALTLAS
jgi:hypothetical protein